MNLKELLGEELAKQVEEKLGDKKLAVVNDGSWLPKEKFNEKLEEIKGLKAEVSARDEQLGQLKSAAQGNEELLKQIADLQAQNEATQLEFSQKLKDTQLSNAIKMALNGKVQDLDIVSNLLDKSSIELDETGNVVKGLEEQVTALKESKAFLFVPEIKETTSIEQPVQAKMSIGNPVSSDNADDDPFAAIMAEYK